MADKVYLPKQRVTRGVPGYKGDRVVVVDPETRREEPAEAPKGKSKSK